MSHAVSRLRQERLARSLSSRVLTVLTASLAVLLAVDVVATLIL